MFTGLVEDLGEVTARTAAAGVLRLTVSSPLVAKSAQHGDSISVNGVCLTVTDLDGDRFSVEVIPETLRRSTLGDVGEGERVNLERAATLETRLGGHLVQGHVDGVATLVEQRNSEAGHVLRFELPAGLARYVVAKGSITVQGVSLTVSAIEADQFEVSLIPTTVENTTLGRFGVGDRCNIEVDVIAKHVEKLLGKGA